MLRYIQFGFRIHIIVADRSEDNLSISFVPKFIYGYIAGLGHGTDSVTVTLLAFCFCLELLDFE